MKHKITGMLAVIGLLLTGCHIHIKSKHLKPQPTIRQKEEVKKIKNEDEELKTSQNKKELEANPKPRFDRPNMKIKKDV